MCSAPAKHRKIPCPVCGKTSPFTPENPFRPFCSQRCKLIDLGAWLEEKHAIPGEPAEIPDADTPKH